MRELALILALGLAGCAPEPRPAVAPPPPAAVPPIAPPAPVATVAVAPPPPPAPPKPAAPPCGKAPPPLKLLHKPNRKQQLKKTTFRIAGKRIPASKRVEVSWPTTGLAPLDAAILEGVDADAVFAAAADLPDHRCASGPDGEVGCQFSRSAKLLHEGPRLVSFEVSVSVLTDRASQYGTSLTTLGRVGETWRKLTVDDVIDDRSAFFDAHKCTVEADDGFAVVGTELHVYDALSFGRTRCRIPLAKALPRLKCPLLALASAL